MSKRKVSFPDFSGELFLFQCALRRTFLKGASPKSAR